MKNIKICKNLHKLLTEGWPSDFDFEAFKKMTNIEQRKYATEKLPKLGKGSSRIVFGIDDKQAIKIAFTTAGIDQNRREYYNYSEDYEILTEIFEADDDFNWIIVERALPIKSEKQFEALFDGVNRYCFIDYIKSGGTGDCKHIIKNNEFFNTIAELCWSMDLLPHDIIFARKNWGLVKRNGVLTPVIVDFGIDNTSYNSYYKNNNMRRGGQLLKK